MADSSFNFLEFILSDDSPIGPEDQADIDLFNNAQKAAEQRLATQQGVFGPYGYLVMPPGLNEEHWRLERDPVSAADIAAGYRCEPLFALSDIGPAKATPPT